MTQEPTRSDDILGRLGGIKDTLIGVHSVLDQLLPREGDEPLTDTPPGVYPALERIQELAGSLRERAEKL